MAVTARIRLGMALQHTREHVEEPGLGDTGGGITRELPVPIVVERAILDLDDEQNLPRRRMGSPLAAAVDDEIGLRLARIVEEDRHLDVDAILVRYLAFE